MFVNYGKNTMKNSTPRFVLWAALLVLGPVLTLVCGAMYVLESPIWALGLTPSIIGTFFAYKFFTEPL